MHCAEKGGILKKPGPYCPLEKERWEDRLSSSSQNNLVNLTSGPMMGEGGPGPGPSSGGDKIMADSGVAATVAVSLHPLVIMNISEHWTR